MPDQGVADSLIGLIRYYRKYEGLVSAGMLWLMLNVNSVFVLAGGLLKVLGGCRSLQWWTREAAKRARLALGREAFHYPKDMRTDLMAGAVVCRP